LIIKLDRERRIEMTLHSMCKFEELTGKSLLQGFDFSAITARDLSALLSACLADEDALAPAEVARLVRPSQFPEIVAALLRCWEESLPESEGSANPPSRSTG
jgi:hypothetical protein